MDAWLEEMKAAQERADANLRERKAEIRANNEKLGVLPRYSTLPVGYPPSQERRQSRKYAGQDRI
jgi:hypothetical protein